MKHKLSALFLAAMISAVSILPAFAAKEGFTEVTQAGNKGESLVTLTVEGEDYEVFSAYVPSVLPIVVDTDGTVHCPSNAVIVNGVETRGIKVTNVTATSKGRWSIVAPNYSFRPETNRYIGFKLAGDSSQSGGFKFNKDNENWMIPKGSYIPLNMEANVTPGSVAPGTDDKSNAVELSFTLAWSGDNETTGEKWTGTLE